MKQLCEHEHVELFVPSAHLCTDNGVMIAWNGMERIQAGEAAIPPDEVDKLAYQPVATLGQDLTHKVPEECIQIPRVKIDLGRLLKDTGNIFADEFSLPVKNTFTNCRPDDFEETEAEELHECESGRDKS